MNVQQLMHVAKNDSIYQFVATGGKTEAELRDFIVGKNEKKSLTSFYDFIRPIKKSGVGLLIMEDGKVVIDSAKARNFVDQLEEFLGLETSEDEFSKLSQRLEEVIAEKEKLNAEIKNLKTECRKSQREIRKLKSQMGEGFQYVRDCVNQKVIVKDSVSIGPITDVMNGLFLDNVDSLIEVEKLPLEVSYYEEIEDDKPEQIGKEHTWGNYIVKSIHHVVTDKLLRKRLDDLVLVKDLEKQPDGIRDEYIELIRRNRRWSVQSILSNKSMTNQEKLAMYGFYSDYHHTDMEQLINFAGDEGINADLLIQILEQSNRQCAFENTRDLLRQFKKPTEFAIRQKFAEELVQGKWYITALCNGEQMKFQLVPITEINELRAIVGLPLCSSAEEKQDIQLAKKRQKKKETSEEDLKSDVDIKSFNCEEDDIDDAPSIECKEETEDGK